MENLHDFVVRRLNEIGRHEWQSVADATEVSVHTIIKIAKREIVSPRFDKLDPLAKYLRDGAPTRIAPDETSHSAA